MNPQMIADYACNTGENPLWHPIEQMLYWTDIPAGRLFRFNPATGEHSNIYEGRQVGGFTFQSDGGLLLFMDRGTVAHWQDGILTEKLPFISNELASRFNDVFADPIGRVFCGTMSSEQGNGRLYRLDTDGSLHLLLENMGCSNGMAISRDHKAFFYTDSFAREIYRFDYDAGSGQISNQTVFSHFREADGLPDGATLDAEGHLWSALWDGGSIVRLDERGRVAERFSLPVPRVTSLTFGGQDLRDIYVTTAGGENKRVHGPLAGALFRFSNLYRGLPEYFSKIGHQPITLVQQLQIK
jgi:sugar lactone lactonase YvrE